MDLYWITILVEYVLVQSSSQQISWESTGTPHLPTTGLTEILPALNRGHWTTHFGGNEALEMYGKCERFLFHSALFGLKKRKGNSSGKYLPEN